jgi:thiol-disulfide isomerase/thioredoxin
MPAPRPRRAARAAAVAGLLGGLLAGCTSGSSVSTDSGTERFRSGDGVATFVAPGKRRPAPPLAGETLSGGHLDVASYGAVPLVLNVWASWCAPCKKEQPVLERVAAATRSRGVRFVGIDIREPGRTAPRRHVARFKVSYPSLYDPGARLLTRFAVPAKTTPTTYVVDARGRIAAYVYGEVDEPGLTALLDRVLAES